MTDHLRFFWFLTLFAFLVTANGCASHWHPINEELEREGTGLQKEFGQTITAYQLNDGPNVDFRGVVKIAGQDSLFFWSQKYLGGRPYPGQYVPGPIFALDAVKALKVQEGSAGPPLLQIFTFAVIVAVLAGGIAFVKAMTELSSSFDN